MAGECSARFISQERASNGRGSHITTGDVIPQSPNISSFRFQLEDVTGIFRCILEVSCRATSSKQVEVGALGSLGKPACSGATRRPEEVDPILHPGNPREEPDTLVLRNTVDSPWFLVGKWGMDPCDSSLKVPIVVPKTYSSIPY